MNLIKRLQAGRFARQLQSSDALEGTIADAQKELIAIGPSAIRTMLESLHGTTAKGPTVEVLVKLLSEETLPAFVEGLHSKDAAVVDAVAAALSQSENYDPVSLLPLFSEPNVSKARLEGILSAQMKRVQPQMLLKVLPDMSKDARGSVFRILEKRADSSIIGEAVQLAVHTEWWLRLHMARLLSRFPTTESTEAVTGLLKDENPAVRLEAVKCLGASQAKSAIPALCLRLRDSDIKVQAATIEALIAIGDVGAVPHLLDCLKDDAEYVRRGAVEVLNQVVTTEAVKDLVQSLRDADWWVRVRAADALGTLGGDRVVEAVISLIDDPDDFVRRYAVEILNTVPDKRAVEPLVRALEDDDWWVRERAIDALAKTGDPRAVEPLIRMLSRDTRAIPLSVKALAALGDARAVEPICRLTTSEVAEVRREAIHALTRMARMEMPTETRRLLGETLESAGVAAERTKLRPMEVRGTHGPEAGRHEEVRRSPAPSDPTPSGVHEAPRPSGEMKSPARILNYQKLNPDTVLIDRFRVLQRIGGGGFGTVYLVEDVIVREEMVLKILSPHLSLDENMIRRFVQELKFTRRITHKNVIRIYDLLDLQGAHAISMEFFQGRDLGQLLRQEGPLPHERVIHLATQICEGLAAAHEMGIIHRDVKPANILVNDADVVKLVDFGLASVGQTTRSRLTQSGILVGTPEYISPEQITGHQVDARTDIYSLGVVLYEMLSGTQPFAGTTAVNVLFQHLESDVAPLTTVAPSVPPALAAVVHAAMSRIPADRPESGAALFAMLQTARS